MFHIFGALGRFERDLIRERTRAKLTAATARGRRGGRRKVVVIPERLEKAHCLTGQGLSPCGAAIRLKVGKTVLYEALRDRSVADL